MHENMKRTNDFRTCEAFMFNFIPELFLNLTICFWNLSVSIEQISPCFFACIYLFIMTQINVLIIFSPPIYTNMICKESVKPNACMSEGSYISVLCLHTRKCSINMAQHGYALYMGTRLKTIPSTHAQLGSAGGGGGHVKFAPLVCKHCSE